jgi:hypothetical protein
MPYSNARTITGQAVRLMVELLLVFGTNQRGYWTALEQGGTG